MYRSSSRPGYVLQISVSRCVDSDGLDRVQRLLTTHGIFQRQHGIFGHTPSSLLLRSDHPVTMRAFAQVMCNATVLVVEDLMPEEQSDPRGSTPGRHHADHDRRRERTVDQLRNLLEGAGFDLSRVIDTPSSMHIVDGLPPPLHAASLATATPPATDRSRRAWNYVTFGDGHDEAFWRAFCHKLRAVGYDDVLSIEHTRTPQLRPSKASAPLRSYREGLPYRPTASLAVGRARDSAGQTSRARDQDRAQDSPEYGNSSTRNFGCGDRSGRRLPGLGDASYVHRSIRISLLPRTRGSTLSGA